MNSESFREKVALSIFDKLIFGILSALVLIIIQNRFQSYQKLNDQTLLVSKIQTEILIDQKKVLINSMTDYFSTIEGLKSEGKANEETSTKLTELLIKIRATFFTMETVSQDIGASSNNLIKSISSLNTELLTRTMLPKEIEDKMESIGKNYSKTLSAIREATKEVLKEEFESTQSG